MITVKQLIEELSQLEPNRIVILACDGEGNGFSPLAGVDTAAYRPDNTWSGEVGLEELSEEDEKAGYSEEDVISDGLKAVVLFPTG